MDGFATADRDCYDNAIFYQRFVARQYAGSVIEAFGRDAVVTTSPESMHILLKTSAPVAVSVATRNACCERHSLLRDPELAAGCTECLRRIAQCTGRVRGSGSTSIASTNH